MSAVRFLLVNMFMWITFATTGYAQISPCPQNEREFFDNCTGKKSYQGAMYEGLWFRNEPNGIGKLGTKEWEYFGNFRNGLRHGYGVETVHGKSKFYGQWAENKKDGAGIQYSADNVIMRSGTWINGEFKAEHKVNLELFAAISSCENISNPALRRLESCNKVLSALQPVNNPAGSVRLKGRNLSFNDVIYIILSNRAYVFGQLGELQKEIEDLNKLQSIRRTEANYVRLGAANLRLGKCSEALESHRTAIASNPNDPYVIQYGYFHSGIAKVLCKNSDSALPDLQRAALEDQRSIYPYIWILINFGDNSVIDLAQSRRDIPWQVELLKSVRKLIANPKQKTDMGLVLLDFVGISNQQKMCEANFYFGYALFMDGQRGRAKFYLNTANSYCPLNYFESAPLKFLLMVLEKENEAPETTPADQPIKASVSAGSGFRFSDQFFVTNYHVVESCKEIKLNDTHLATVVARNLEADLAILRSPSFAGRSASLRVNPPKLNESVIAAGYPLQSILTGLSITNGTVSRLAGISERQFQISTPIQPGNSGGPVIDASGNVIGIVVSTLDTLKVAKLIDAVPQNVNFAIKVEELRKILDAERLPYSNANRDNIMPPTELAKLASEFTISIKCK